MDSSSIPAAPTQKTQIDTAYREAEEKMTALLGSRVSINPRSRKKGKIEIEYYSDEDLDRIVSLLMNVSRETF